MHSGSPPAASLRRLAIIYQLASTQGYQTMDTGDGATRPQVREATLEEYRKEPSFAKEDEPPEGADALSGF
jgi:hypothetical protein